MTNKPELKIEAGKFYRDGYQRKWEVVKVVANRFLAVAVYPETKPLAARWFYMDGTPVDKYNTDCEIKSEWIDAPEVDWSVIPPWFKWIAMDKNGKWFAFSEKPESSSKDEMFFNGSKTTNAMEIPKDYAPKFTGDWKDSLVCRLGVEK